MRIRRGFDVVISTSFRRCHFDVESASIRRGFRRGFGKKSMRFRHRFDVVISTSNLCRNDKDFDEDSARNRRGFDEKSTRFRRGFDEVSTSKSFRRGFDEDSMWIRRRFDVVEIFKVSVK